MFTSTKQCLCKLLFQFQRRLKEAATQVTRASSLRVEEALNKPLDERRYDKHQSTPNNETGSTFRFKDLSIKLCDPDKRKTQPDVGSIKFGQVFTDHMLKIYYHKKLGGWQKPTLIPFENITLHPAAQVLHYAVELFEGTKAYRGVDGKIRLFRPEINMARMNGSAIRAGLPTFDGDELLKCLKRLIQVDHEWVPHGETSSLYLRPMLMGIDASLIVEESESALLCIIMSPVGSYFAGKDDAVSLYTDPSYIRAWPGGFGDKKLGPNYGPTITVHNKALQKGRQQVLWLYGPDHQVTEAGITNIFMFYQDEHGKKVLVTPPLDGLILPGITRLSVIQLCEQWKEFSVVQRTITMAEIIQLQKSNRLLEMFGSGTGALISPIGSIEYMDNLIEIPTTQHQNPLHRRIRDELKAIKYGHINHPWAQPID